MEKCESTIYKECMQSAARGPIGSPTHLDMERAGDYVRDDEVDECVGPRPASLEQCTKPTPKEGDPDDL